jgi:hypothetical protein
MTTLPVFYEGATIPLKTLTSDILNPDATGNAPSIDASAVALAGYRSTSKDADGHRIFAAPVVYTLAGSQVARIAVGTYETFHPNALRGFWLWKTTATIGGRDFVTVLSLQVEAGPG